jgi:ribosomal protein S17
MTVIPETCRVLYVRYVGIILSTSTDRFPIVYLHYQFKYKNYAKYLKQGTKHATDSKRTYER